MQTHLKTTRNVGRKKSLPLGSSSFFCFLYYTQSFGNRFRCYFPTFNFPFLIFVCVCFVCFLLYSVYHLLWSGAVFKCTPTTSPHIHSNRQVFSTLLVSASSAIIYWNARQCQCQCQWTRHLRSKLVWLCVDEEYFYVCEEPSYYFPLSFLAHFLSMIQVILLSFFLSFVCLHSTT